MRLALATALLVATAAPAAAAGPTSIPAGPVPLWQTELDGPWIQSVSEPTCTRESAPVRSVVADDAGALYLAGRGENRGYWRQYIAKFEADGTLAWFRNTDDSSSSSTDAGFVALQSAPTGIVGWVVPKLIGNHAGYKATAFSADGTELWSVETAGPAPGLTPSAAVIDETGAIVVVGTESGGVGFIARHPGSGPASWWHEEPTSSGFRGARPASSGEVLAWGAGVDQDMVGVFALGIGATLLAELPSDGANSLEILDAAVASDGNVVGTGSSCDGATCAVIGFEVSSSGTIDWIDSWFRAPGQGTGRYVLPDGPDEIYIAGEVQAEGAFRDAILLRIGPSGALLWDRRLDGQDHRTDTSAGVVDIGGGEVLWAASLGTQTSSDIAVSILNVSGKIETAVFDLYGIDSACDAALAGNRRIAVAGSSTLIASQARLTVVGSDLSPDWSAVGPPMASPDDWLAFTGGGPLLKGSALSFGPDGDLWIGGTARNTRALYAPTVMHVDSSGSPIGKVVAAELATWLNRSEEIAGIAARGTGVVAAGHFYDGEYRPFAVAYDQDLEEVARYTDGSLVDAFPRALFLEGDGSLRVPMSWSPAQGAICRVLVLDSELAPIAVTDSSGEICEAWDVTKSTSGNVWMSGRTYPQGAPQGPADCIVFGVDADGAVLWQSSFGDESIEENCSSVTSAGSRVVAGGYSFVEGEHRAMVVSFDALGALEWTLGPEEVPGQVWLYISDMLALPTGAVILGLNARIGGSGPSPLVAKVSETGNVDWLTVLGQTGGIADVVVSEEGALYIAGHFEDLVLVKLAPDGVPVWGIRDEELGPRRLQGRWGIGLDAAQDPYLVVSVGLSSESTGIDLLITKLPGNLDLFNDGFETGDTSRWSSALP